MSKYIYIYNKICIKTNDNYYAISKHNTRTSALQKNFYVKWNCLFFFAFLFIK